MQILIEPHPSLRVAAFVTELDAPLGEAPTPGEILRLLRLDAPAPFHPEEPVRTAVRDVLRHGGYKPTGRGKPASEYLVRAAGEGMLGSINPVVDLCNAVSLHSGFPISLVDLELARPPLRIAIAPPGSTYVFNRAEQEIDASGLVCLLDAEGPCANAVKDAQRTKTRPGTRRTLSIVWGAAGHEERLAAAAGWYRDLVPRLGARVEDVSLAEG